MVRVNPFSIQDTERTRLILENVSNLTPSFVVGYPHPLQVMVDILIPLQVPLLVLAGGLLILGIWWRRRKSQGGINNG